MADLVCIRCIGDEDLQGWIAINGVRGKCDFCNRIALTVPIPTLSEHMEECLSRYWGRAVDQLPYNSREGGYQGRTWDSQEILFDIAGLHLPFDDSGKLEQAISWSLSDEIWCDYDWLRLDEDVAMISSWGRFCEVVKHERRFFFQNSMEDSEDSFSPQSILEMIAKFSEAHGMVVKLKARTRLYRARPNFNKRKPAAEEFGPPPKNVCQSNRMNPAGVPMFYGALNPKTAVREVKSESAKVGSFETTYPLRILDLTRLPREPGYFSVVARRTTLELAFLNHFAQDIMQPVERDDRVHTEYVPSQIVTEFLRDHEFGTGKIDGIIYGSVAAPGMKNLVMFIDTLTPQRSHFNPITKPPLNFLGARLVHVATAPRGRQKTSLKGKSDEY